MARSRARYGEGDISGARDGEWAWSGDTVRARVRARPISRAIYKDEIRVTAISRSRSWYIYSARDRDISRARYRGNAKYETRARARARSISINGYRARYISISRAIVINSDIDGDLAGYRAR